MNLNQREFLIYFLCVYLGSLVSARLSPSPELLGLLSGLTPSHWPPVLTPHPVRGPAVHVSVGICHRQDVKVVHRQQILLQSTVR
jgi:hypothetical protein